jgi:RND superfamily putative drug exporter
MGFALAVAVLFDAFIVRMTIIPAVMFLLGENAWKIPRWLGRHSSMTVADQSPAAGKHEDRGETSDGGCREPAA